MSAVSTGENVLFKFIVAKYAEKEGKWKAIDLIWKQEGSGAILKERIFEPSGISKLARTNARLEAYMDTLGGSYVDLPYSWTFESFAIEYILAINELKDQIAYLKVIPKNGYPSVAYSFPFISREPDLEYDEIEKLFYVKEPEERGKKEEIIF